VEILRERDGLKWDSGNDDVEIKLIDPGDLRRYRQDQVDLEDLVFHNRLVLIIPGQADELG
jgi:hypothetical protein